MTLKHVKGDLIKLAEKGEFDVIVHGCNCFNTMGSGIARSIRERYPQAYAADEKTVAGDIGKLGNYTSAVNTYEELATHQFTIINAYTQYGFNKAGETADMFEYASFELILAKLSHKAGHLRYGLPYIGMGLAGGDKNTIMEQIEYFAEKVTEAGGTVTLVEFG